MEKVPPTTLIIAFGSQVTGKSTPASDFDFGVFQKEPLSLDDRVDIVGFLAEKFKINEDKIDLVNLVTASPLLKFEVAKKGKLIQGTLFDFIRFKVRTFKEYVDTAKFRRIREQRMMKNYV